MFNNFIKRKIVKNLKELLTMAYGELKDGDIVIGAEVDPKNPSAILVRIEYKKKLS